MSTLHLERRNGQLVACIDQAHLLNETQIHQANRMLLDICAQAAAKGVPMVVDFEGVQFISSAMIGKLLMLRKEAEHSGVELFFRNLCSEIQQVIKVMRLNEAFQLTD